MTFIENLENKVVILKTLTYKRTKAVSEVVIEEGVSLIDIDYSLIRYLCANLKLKDVIINNSGYPVIRREDNSMTTLSRFILEYYSQYSSKLKTILENKELEINHINKNKRDNRLNNLEIVTHSNNMKHKNNIAYEIVIKSEELCVIQEKNINNMKQDVDKKYLKRISGLFNKSLKLEKVDEIILKCSYLEFKYNKNTGNNNKKKDNVEIKECNFSRYKTLTNFYTKQSIILLVKSKKYFIFKSIVESNLLLLNRFINRYKYLKRVLEKYKLLNNSTKEELKFDRSNSKNLLLEFYKDIFDLEWFSIVDGNILVTINIKNCFNVRGKNKSFLILYLLGLLVRLPNIKRPNNISKRFVHTPSFIKIPRYTEELLIKANVQAKKLLDLNLNKLTYFIVREEFGMEIADNIYKNEKSRFYYKYGIQAKEDIINLLITDKDIKLHGFITKEDIFEYIQGLNSNRMLKGKEYSKIFDSFTFFISSLFLYNSEIKEKLKDLGLEYVSLNKETITAIKKHQIKQNLNFYSQLKPRNKVIILKSLKE